MENSSVLWVSPIDPIREILSKKQVFCYLIVANEMNMWVVTFNYLFVTTPEHMEVIGFFLSYFAPEQFFFFSHSDAYNFSAET